MESKALFQTQDDDVFHAFFFSSDVNVLRAEQMRRVNLIGYRMDVPLLLDVAWRYAFNRNWKWNSIVITDYKGNVVAMRMSLSGQMCHLLCMDWSKETGWTESVPVAATIVK